MFSDYVRLTVQSWAEWISSELEAVAPGGTDYLGDYIAPKHLHVGDRREVRISPHLDPGDTALEGGDQTRSPDFPAADPSIGAHGQWDRPAGLATYVPSSGHGPVLRDRQQPAESGAHRSDGIRLRIIELDDLIEPSGLEYPAHRTGKRA